MGYFGTTTMALAMMLFAVPSASFTLPSVHHLSQQSSVHARVGLVGGRHVGLADSSISEVDLAELRTQADLMIDLLEESSVSVTEESDKQQEKEQKSNSNVGDIIRDLDGRPLTKEYFAEAMGISNVESYTCPEEDAFRGFMSNACRVHLVPGGETAFYKHIVFEGLDHAQEKLKTAPHKLLRDAQSYQVVASFLLSKACHLLTETTGVQIPRCYDAQLQPNPENPMLSKFSFLFEDFSPHDGWYQQWLLHETDEVEAALSTFAKIHAYFWHGSDFWKNNVEAGHELEAGVWTSGSYVQPTAQGHDQWKRVASEWATKKLKFETELSGFEWWDNLGDRLESVAEECGRVAHPFAECEPALSEQYQQYRTFTHGDPKQANLLFRRSTTATENSDDSNNASSSSKNTVLQLGLIDFQWSGFGLASTDIAHFITSAVHADRLVDGGEERLMRFYFDELQTHLVDYGAFDTVEEAAEKFRYETFVDQYEIAVLDICRLMIAYTWDRFEEPVEIDDKAGCARTMNKTSYNKSIPNIIWLMSRCDEILKSRGV